jgi:hypothetical protein
MPEDQWHRELEKGRTDILADDRTGQHSTRRTEVKAEQVGEQILVKSTRYMGGHGIDNTMEVEVAVCELLRMQDPDLYCLATFRSCQDRANVSLCPRIVLKNIGT